MNVNGGWMNEVDDYEWKIMNEVDECDKKMNEWGRWMWMEDKWMRSMNVNLWRMNEVDECEWKMNERGRWI